MEQILVRKLPPGTKAALKARALRHHRSLEAEVRALIADAVADRPVSIVDLVASPWEVEFDFEPDRLGTTARSAEL